MLDYNNQQIQDAASSHGRANRIWLITFTDLVALMLTFFVMLFAMSNVKTSEWQNVIDSLSQTLRPEIEKTARVSTSSFNIGTIFRGRATNLDYLASVLGDVVDGDALLSLGRLMRLEDRLIIALPGDLLFEAEGAALTERGRQALFLLGGVLRNIGNRIGVNDHSGAPRTAPSSGGEGRSNWELSTTRAAMVANALRQSGYPDDIIAFGYADSRSGSFSGLPESLRETLSRRLEIVVRPDAGGS